MTELSPPYAEPRVVTDAAECYFYHTLEIPGHGLVEGQWDLRKGVDDYAGRLDYAGKRILEVGTASGFLCFWMEQQGAEVVAYDLSEEQSWDVVPFASAPVEDFAADRRAVMRSINNGWWFAHRAFRSSAKVVYGTVYEIPETIGPVDISTYCSILLHLRDPFLALQRGSVLTRETMLVTDLAAPLVSPHPRDAEAAGGLPAMRFLPDHRTGEPQETWWNLSPEIVQAFLGVLGFADSTVSSHMQGGVFGEYEMFSVVAHRTAGHAIGS